jgi:hypothetical protein
MKFTHNLVIAYMINDTLQLLTVLTTTGSMLLGGVLHFKI